MSWKRRLAMSALAAGLCGGWHVARAEDPAPAPKKDDAAAAPAEPPKKKEPFFGDHFAMYLETRGGPADLDTLKNPVTSGAQSNSVSTLDFNGNKTGQFTIGWTLPRGRGQYLLTYNGIADGDFELSAQGTQQRYQAVGGTTTIDFLAPWWQLTVNDGNLRVQKTPPVWGLIDDANGNTFPDPDELRFPVTTVDLQSTTPKDLGNRIQTWDLLYRREFGGLKIHARWSAGIRYLDYQGAIPVPSWLTGVPSNGGVGYSDGVQNSFIVMQESTSGFGPVGSGEVDFSFFRQRLTLYGLVQAAYLMETLEADSGTFMYLADDRAGGVFPGPGRIHDDIHKSTWNTTFEAGLRVKILEGFNFIADWNKTGYLDTVLVPADLSIPTNAFQITLGTTATFVSRDFIVTSVNVGLSFQF
jgi:hypothetical protein